MGRGVEQLCGHTPPHTHPHMKLSSRWCMGRMLSELTFPGRINSGPIQFQNCILELL